MEELKNSLKEQKVSVVVPCLNEVDNLEPLLEDLGSIAEYYKFYEVLIIDDGSDDGTYEEAVGLKTKYQFVRVIRHLRNFGLTIALSTGFKKSQGDIIVVWAGDMQYKAHDLIRLTEKLATDEVHMVCGQKEGRYEKKLVSNMYNLLTRKMFGIKVSDQNSVKAFKKEILVNMRLRSSWHRYIVAIASFYGYRIVEVPVKVYPRMFGKSKFYSLSRIIVGMLDLISVKIELGFSLRPMILFGLPGITISSLAVLIALISYALKHTFELSPEYKVILLLLIVTMFLVGVILFCFGIICDVLKGIIDSQEKEITNEG